MLTAHKNKKWLAWFVIAAAVGAIVVSAFELTLMDVALPVLFLTLIINNIANHISIRIPRLRGQISLSEVFILMSILIFDGEAAVLLAALVGVCAFHRSRDKTTPLLFRAALMPLSAFLLTWTLRATVGPLLVLNQSLLRQFVAICAIAVVNALIQFAARPVDQGDRVDAPAWQTYSESGPWILPLSLVAAILSFVMVRLVWLTGFYTTVIGISIMAILYLTYRLSVRSRRTETSVTTLRDSMELFRMAFDYASIGMALVSQSGRWLRVNHSLCEILGYSQQELLACDFHSVIHPDDVAASIANINQLLGGKLPTYQTEKRYVHKDGHVVWVLWSVSQARIETSDSVHLIFQIQDITDRRHAEERLLHDAFHDALTGLPNRALLIDHLKLTIARAKRNKAQMFAVLFLDLDRFKLVNDSLGHMIGDQLLVGIARRLESCLRQGDTVARVGGDEFTILLEDIHDEAEATMIAERIHQELKVPFNLGGREVFTTVSIGIAPSSMGYSQPDEILRDADTAMYRAKSLGKARHEVFDEDMHALALDLLQMENDLRRALERNELFIEYQPIVSLNDFRLGGFEALLRWQHPRRGLISPLDFIPVAEEGGQILQIGQWILKEACRQMRQWQEKFPADPPLFVTVNLSAKQFGRLDLIDQIRSILNETGLDANSLKLEITESVVMENIEAATEMLCQLRALGVRLSIDDFGTGYSSLSYLHRFPIDTLKIDRSFVTRIVNDKENIEIVRTILMLAENLGMDVVAEGVETQEQMALLRNLSCQSGQGYFFSKPINVPAAEKIILETYAPPKALVA